MKFLILTLVLLSCATPEIPKKVYITTQTGMTRNQDNEFIPWNDLRIPGHYCMDGKLLIELLKKQ